ncbi:MAG: hypothetical protein R3304_05150 [Longimicrobiales bacterium]|nr:hypothetical protein [Longimicrobiales bacterium]
MGLFLRGRFDSAATSFRHADELDTTAVGYLLWEAVWFENLDDRTRVARTLDDLRPRRDELTRFDAAQFAWLEAMGRGDRAAELRGAQAARAEHPHSGLGGYQVGRELPRSGRPRAALDVILSLDPDVGWDTAATEVNPCCVFGSARRRLSVARPRSASSCSGPRIRPYKP